jgi:hypothetical protein
MRRTAAIFTATLAVACGPRPPAQEPEPEPTTGTVEPAQPHVDVPPLSSYSWLDEANILLAPQGEVAAVEAKLVDYYSGLPMFMKVLAHFTRDRNVGLKDNPAYLSEIWAEYLSLMDRSEDDPPLSVSEFDATMVQWALFRAWKSRNEHSPVDNYDDAVTSADYGE